MLYDTADVEGVSCSCSGPAAIVPNTVALLFLDTQSEYTRL